MDWCSFGLKEWMKPCAGNVQSLGNTDYQKLYRVEMKVQKPKDIKTPSDTPTLIDRKEEGVPLHCKNIGYLWCSKEGQKIEQKYQVSRPKAMDRHSQNRVNLNPNQSISGICLVGLKTASCFPFKMGNSKAAILHSPSFCVRGGRGRRHVFITELQVQRDWYPEGSHPPLDPTQMMRYWAKPRKDRCVLHVRGTGIREQTGRASHLNHPQ